MLPLLRQRVVSRPAFATGGAVTVILAVSLPAQLPLFVVYTALKLPVVFGVNIPEAVSCAVGVQLPPAGVPISCMLPLLRQRAVSRPAFAKGSEVTVILAVSFDEQAPDETVYTALNTPVAFGVNTPEAESCAVTVHWPPAGVPVSCTGALLRQRVVSLPALLARPGVTEIFAVSLERQLPLPVV
jgi:hypothetical protein